LDSVGSPGKTTLGRLEQALADGFPVAFGFPVISGLELGGERVPIPTERDSIVGGHAVLAVGYDRAERTVTIRNSWGPWWGKEGYGRLPYDYVERELARDFWFVIPVIPDEAAQPVAATARKKKRS